MVAGRVGARQCCARNQGFSKERITLLQYSFNPTFRIAVLPPPASSLFELADVQTLSLSSFYCFIDNLIRLIVTMFQL